MNLNTIRTTAERAAVTVTRKGLPALRLPIFVVWGHSAATPKVTILAALHRGAVFAAARCATAGLFLGLRAHERLVAIGTCTLFAMLVAPPGDNVAGMRAVQGTVTTDCGLYSVKGGTASRARAMLPSVSTAGYAFGSLIPDSRLTLLRTVLSRIATFKDVAARMTRLVMCLHSSIISQVWLKESYHALALKNVARLSTTVQSPQMSIFDEVEAEQVEVGAL